MRRAITKGISFPQSTSVPNHVYRPKMTAGTSGSAPLILPFMSNLTFSSGIHATATKQRFMPCSHVQMDFMRRISGVDHRNLIKDTWSLPSIRRGDALCI